MNDYYEKNAQSYFHSTVNVDPASFLSPLVNLLCQDSTILDIGCGSGRDLLWLKDKGFCPTGLENSSALAQLAQENSICHVIKADFLSYDFSQVQYDALIVIGALVHLEREQILNVLKSFLEALVNGGYILLTSKEGQGKNVSSDGRIFTLWRQSELEDIFKQLNLKILDCRRQISKIRATDVWLGHLMQKNE